MKLRRPTFGGLRGQRATIDTAEFPVISPRKPIDLRDDAEVAHTLTLSMRVGDVLLASGTSAMDTTLQMVQVAESYGLPDLQVDVTYNSIVVSAQRGSELPPASAVRIVKHRSVDFTRLAQIDRVIRDIFTSSITPEEAHTRIDEINAAPHPYRRWVATLAWSGMSASLAVFLGGGPLVAIVSFVVTAVIDRIGRLLNRMGLPFFFQQVVGGFIATGPAAVLYRYQEPLGISISPAQIVAAGVIVLLSGLSLVGSVQDAITGAPVTAAGRLFEVMMLTGGIIAGVALALRCADFIGIAMPPLTDNPMTTITQLPIKVVSSAIGVVFFALASYAERRALAAAAVGGAVGMVTFSLLDLASVGPVIASAVAATAVGAVGGLAARRALTPPLVVAVAGITPLLPGLAVYRALYSLLNDQSVVGYTALAAAFGVGVALAAGVTLGEWFARTLRRPRFLRA